MTRFRHYLLALLLLAAGTGSAAFWYIGAEGVDLTARALATDHIADLDNPHEVTPEQIGIQSTLIETAWQNPASAADWTWTSNGREITLTGYSGPNAVVIPDMLDGLPVTGLGGIFSGNQDITSVGGGANIKAVGYSAFISCAALISVSLPACTTVGDFAFAGCVALNSVSLPACTTVGAGVFENCGALNSVSLPACTTVGNAAFAGCVALNSISLPACTTVGNYAFISCAALISVSLPACTTVGDFAFAGCVALNSISLPACTTVGNNAFSDCAALTSIALPACITVGSYAFYECEALNSVTFGQNAPAQAADVFESSTPTSYVFNPHATGWGDTWNGRPVVRAASVVDIASHNTNTAAHADIRALIGGASQYSAWTTNVVSSGTNVITSAWGNQPRLELNGDAVIDFDFAEATAGNHRLTLSLWSGSHSVAWLTNNVDFAEAPELSTNAYNTILIRKTGSAKAEGRQL